MITWREAAEPACGSLVGARRAEPAPQPALARRARVPPRARWAPSSSMCCCPVSEKKKKQRQRKATSIFNEWFVACCLGCLGDRCHHRGSFGWNLFRPKVAAAPQPALRGGRPGAVHAASGRAPAPSCSPAPSAPADGGSEAAATEGRSQRRAAGRASSGAAQGGTARGA